MYSLVKLLTVTTQVVVGIQRENLFPNFDLVPVPKIEIIEQGDGILVTQGSDVTVHFEMFDESGEKI